MQAGVSTYLALTFGTLLSSQGTDASFGPVSPGPSGRFPSFLRFRLYQTLSCPIPGRSGLLRYYFSLSSSSLSRFPFGVLTTLADFLGDS